MAPAWAQPPLRAFGNEQLDTAAILDTVRQAHAGQYATRAAAAVHGYWSGETGRAGAQVLADTADYRTATACLVTAGQLDTALSIGAHLAWWIPKNNGAPRQRLFPERREGGRR